MTRKKRKIEVARRENNIVSKRRRSLTGGAP